MPKDQTYHQIALALEILKELAQQPLTRNQLVDVVSAFQEKQGKVPGDTQQQVTRLIRKLRESGIDIKSAPHHPYKLVHSTFPVILSPEQRASLALAVKFLDGLGFPVEANHLLSIGHLYHQESVSGLKADFSPPVDYSDQTISEKISLLRERCEEGCRFCIDYESRQGNREMWDLDKSELRYHQGSLYLFSFVPTLPYTFHSQAPFPRQPVDHNILFRVDRILNIPSISQTRWFMPEFPTLEITYQLTGKLSDYQSRRSQEIELERNQTEKFVKILTREDCIFWFMQRILQYGESAQVLEPVWLAKRMRKRLQAAYQNYDTQFPD